MYLRTAYLIGLPLGLFRGTGSRVFIIYLLLILNLHDEVKVPYWNRPEVGVRFRNLTHPNFWVNLALPEPPGNAPVAVPSEGHAPRSLEAQILIVPQSSWQMWCEPHFPRFFGRDCTSEILTKQLNGRELKYLHFSVVFEVFDACGLSNIQRLTNMIIIFV